MGNYQGPYIRVSGFRAQDLEGQGIGIRVPGLAFRIRGLRFSLGFRV